MKFKQRTSKLYAFALAAVFALALAGCGGGGGGTTEAPPDPPPMPTPQEVCENAGGRYNADGSCTSAAELAQEMIDASQMAAAAAAAAADVALNSAKAAVSGVSGIQDYDALHYGLAEGALDDARRAKQAADAANQAAMDADTPAAAAAAQADAERAQAAAEAALATASTFVQAVKDAKAEADRLAEEERQRQEMEAAEQKLTEDLAAAVSRASAANSAAAMASSSAATAVATVTAMEGATPAHGASAQASAGRAAAAAAAALAAHANAISAQNDRDLAAANAAAASAEQAKMDAETALGEINMIITGLQDDINMEEAERQRMADVASARSAAMQSYMDAADDATKAETAASEAEEAAPGSPGAMAARAAADAARTAANAAKAAHDAITDGMTKAEADAQADEAATQAGNANSGYMTAKAENDEIQNSAAVVAERQRQRDIADATSAASDAAMAARTAATNARTAATNARTAANAANAAYMRAMAARTDSDAAKMQADAAAEAATAAENAATAAEMAATAAEEAHMGINPDGSAADAQTAQMTAETKQGEAEGSAGTASTQYMTASTARDEAMTDAGNHVLQLFLAANGAHVMDAEGTPANETAAHVTSVGAAMAAIANAASGAQAAGTTVTITHPGDTVDNPATEDDPATLETVENNEFSEGMLEITVNVAGTTNIVAKFGADRAADTTATPPVTQRIQTARKIADLGPFQGYELWEDDGNADTGDFADRARAIVFTNKQKGDDSVLAVTAATARTVENVAVDTTTLTKLGTKSGSTYTGAEYTPSGESALTGTLTCPSGVSCSVDATTAADGTVTINAVSGYVFTGSRAAREAVTAADATDNNNYLAFGLWLEESDDGATDTFGSFAVGGTGYAVNVANAVTGTAMYSGNAAGAHHRTGDGVNFFSGDANLTANFGANDAPGSISGAISNIRVNGGAAMSAPIYLGQAALSDGSATFNGAAFMGAPTAPGASTHEFDGTWSGSFFGATDNDTTTTDVDESITAPLAAAGTFGVTKSTGTGDDMVVESFVGAFGANKQLKQSTTPLASGLHGPGAQGE